MKLTFIQRLCITGDHRRKLYRALAKVAADGKSWYAALEVMAVEFTVAKHPLAPLAKIVMLRMRGAGVSRPGQLRRTLGSELAGMVPADEAMLIQAGELSARMAPGLLNAAELVMTKGKLKKSVLQAMMKPAGYFGALMAVLIYISVSLLPQFAKTKPRANWTDDGQLLGAVSDHVTLIVGGCVALVIAAAAALQWLVPRWTGPMRLTADKHIFPFTLIAEINGASFLKTLAGYIAAGTPFSDAVSNIAKSATPYMQEQCSRLDAFLRLGRRPEDAICSLSILPQKYHWFIKTYAMSSDAAKIYEDIADELTTSVEEFVTKLFGLIGVIMQFGVGLLIVWIYGALNDIATSSGPM